MSIAQSIFNHHPRGGKEHQIQKQNKSGSLKKVSWERRPREGTELTKIWKMAPVATSEMPATAVAVTKAQPVEKVHEVEKEVTALEAISHGDVLPGEFFQSTLSPRLRELEIVRPRTRGLWRLVNPKPGILCCNGQLKAQISVQNGNEN